MKQPCGGVTAFYAVTRSFMKIFFAALLFADASLAAVATDGSLGPQRSLTGPEFDISADLGRISGGNLFHSFAEFGFTAGESATFSGPAHIENIIGRVTGGTPSLIDGTLRSAIQGADLYLLNPAGIMFGPNAALDITGSFHVSTADYLRFGDNSRFSATSKPSQVLSAAPPEAFGFLKPRPADISVSDTHLAVPQGESLSLIGGDIDITGKTKTAQITAASGRIEIVGVGNSGEIQLDSPEILTSKETGNGDIHITNAEISVNGAPPGSVIIKGGRIEMNTALITSNNLGMEDARGPGIDIEAKSQLDLLENSNIYCTSKGDGAAGEINITAGWIHMDDSHIGPKYAEISEIWEIWKKSYEVSEEILYLMPEIDERIRGLSEEIWEISGKLNIKAGRLEILNGSSVHTFAADNTGEIQINVADTLKLVGGEIASLSCFGEENGGKVDVTADTILLQGESFISSLTLSNNYGGDNNVTADTILLQDESVISSLTLLNGCGGDNNVTADSILLQDESVISSWTLSNGEGGDNNNTTNSILLQDESVISSSALSNGEGGDNNITTNSILLQDESIISSLVASNGYGGNSIITADTILLKEMATICSISKEVETGGNIFIHAKNLSLFDNTAIFSVGEIYGNAGDIDINCTDKILLDNGYINSSIVGLGNGGDIHMSAQIIDIKNWSQFRGRNLMSTGQIDSAANIDSAADIIDDLDGMGNAGNIRLEAEKLIRLTDTKIRADVQGGSNTTGGNIRLLAPYVILNDASIAAYAYQGRGGNISILADLFLADAMSRVDASSALGISGTVNVQAPESNPGDRFSPLETDFFNAAGLLREPCEVRVSEGDYGSFVVRNRDALPVIPGALYMSPYPDNY